MRLGVSRQAFGQRTRWLALACGACVVAAALAVIALRNDSASGGKAYPVEIAAGVAPRMTAEQVATVALESLPPGATIIRMNALPDEAAVTTLEPAAGSPNPDLPPIGPVWVVRARGSFAAGRTPPGGQEITADTGFFVIDDRNGEVLTRGMP
jgi:hypothetical protein